ncbi:MAG: MarR family transcriptional regulator, partial [Pseudomonadota bacterium]
ENDGRNVGDLASSLSMETSTLTPLLKRLELQGFVARVRSRKDERQVVVSLTPKGRDLESQAGAITACMIRDTALRTKELEQMVKTLERLRAGLSKVPPAL